MTERRAAVAGTAQGLHPRQIIRKVEGPKFFGLGASQIDQAIKDGKIPRPFPLIDGGRALGWTLQQVIDHQAKRKAAAKRLFPRKRAFSGTAE
jgi:predicted DNA-binding transcriptional regulator AlpA